MEKIWMDRTKTDSMPVCMPGRRFFACLALILLAVAFELVGCGKKGPPLPPALSMPPTISGLDARVDGKNIVLSWKVEKNTKNSPTGFFIYRGMVVCASCPVKSVLIARVSFKSEPVHTFVDNPGKFGRYEYSIRCVDEYGIKGPVSSVAVFLPEDDSQPVVP